VKKSVKVCLIVLVAVFGFMGLCVAVALIVPTPPTTKPTVTKPKPAATKPKPTVTNPKPKRKKPKTTQKNTH